MSAPSDYKQSVTVPLPSDGDVRTVIGEDYDPDTTLNVIKMFAGTGEFYPVLIGMVRAIFGTPDINDKHREMIILRSASILDVPYEWQANKVFASNAGLTDTEIQATTSGGPVSGVAPDYVLICAATDELLGTGTLTDDTLSTMLDTFGPVVTRKYIVTISWFSMLSLFLNATRMPRACHSRRPTRSAAAPARLANMNRRSTSAYQRLRSNIIAGTLPPGTLP